MADTSRQSGAPASRRPTTSATAMHEQTVTTTLEDLPCFFRSCPYTRSSLKTGMNAELSPPPAMNMKIGSGMRARSPRSRCPGPNPNLLANAVSRSRPRRRLRNMQKTMMPPLRTASDKNGRGTPPLVSGSTVAGDGVGDGTGLD